jgi:hypothetical protein
MTEANGGGMSFTSTQSTELVLIVGSLVAILVGIMGRKNKDGNEFKAWLRIISAIMGAVMILWSILMVLDGTWNIVMLLMNLLLGVGLLLPLMPKLHLGTIIALVLALVAGGLVSGYGGWAVIIVFLLVFLILWFVLRLIFGVGRMAGRVLGSRLALLVLGVLGIIVAAGAMLT